jgi:hypothetical protein
LVLNLKKVEYIYNNSKRVVSVFFSNTSGLGPANAVIGIVEYSAFGSPQTHNVINISNIPQPLNPPPTVGSLIKFTTLQITSNPASREVKHVSDAMTRVIINFTPGGVVG